MRKGFLDPYVRMMDEKQINMFGIAVEQHGVLVDEYRWKPDQAHPLHSMSKSYTSIAVGMAIDEGRLRLEDRVIDFFPTLLPEKVSDYTAAMTVRDLLIMASGHSQPILMSGRREQLMQDWAEAFLAAAPERAPGQVFVYDSGCTYMLSRIIHRTTGLDLLEYLRPRLFDPLGIDNPVWDRCPMGFSLGGAGLWLRTKQSLPFGRMLLQKGWYNGKQLVSETWVEQATSFQIATDNCGFFYDKSLGYGYQFWMARQGAYRASGAHGQGCFVIPNRDAVITYNANTPDMQGILEGLWDLVIPQL
jgi:CubicO group peptidase (beta-lactamase class C family)